MMQYNLEGKESQLNVAEPSMRYCTIRKSLEDSLKEVQEIKDGKKSALTLNDLFSNIDKWREEKGI